MKEYFACIELEGRISIATYESMDMEAAQEVAKCIARHMSSEAKVRSVDTDEEP